MASSSDIKANKGSVESPGSDTRREIIEETAKRVIELDSAYKTVVVNVFIKNTPHSTELEKEVNMLKISVNKLQKDMKLVRDYE